MVQKPTTKFAAVVIKTNERPVFDERENVVKARGDHLHTLALPQSAQASDDTFGGTSEEEGRAD